MPVGFPLTSGGGGGMAIGGAVAGGTSGSVLFINSLAQLAQDNANFFWDDTLFNLKIGGAYFISSARALYVVPNVTSNNWFEGAAGNSTVTGFGNFGTGDGALASLTTGFLNVAIGSNAMHAITAGDQNFALGSNSMLFSQSDKDNVAIGATSLQQLGNAGAGGGNNSNNVAIGFGAMNQVEIASGNVVMGFGAMANVATPTTASFNVVIGNQAGDNLGVGGGAAVSNNTLIGAGAGRNITGASIQNTFIGAHQGPSATKSNAVALSDGAPFVMFDNGLTNTNNVWSMNYIFQFGLPCGLHIYNFQDALGAAITTYERAVFDWTVTTNILTIGTQNSGGGTSVRNMKFVIGNVNKLDYGVTNAGLWTFAQATMFATSVTLTDGSAAQIATLTNGPTAGNPTKWIPINDNGVTRFIPAW